MKFSMTCTCGHVMDVEAANRDEAIVKMKAMMDQAGLDAHWNEFHQNDTNPKPTVEQSHMMIEQNLQQAS